MGIKRLGRQSGNDYPAGLNLVRYGNYQVTKSLRFKSGSSTYMNRTGSNTTAKTWTFSVWVKRGKTSSGYHTMFAGYNGDETYATQMFFSTDDTLQFYNVIGGTLGNGGYAVTNAKFRDVSAWYHVMYAVDTTQSSATTAFKIYVNGVQQTLSSWGYGGGTNQNTYINYTQRVGLDAAPNTDYFDGLMTEAYFVDGQALTPSSFGATDPITGQWQPIAYSGSYGTNGWYLPFTNTTSTFTLGNDAGNGNNFTTNNFSLTAGATYDSMTDVPTLTSSTAANYATLNPLKRNVCTISNANLTASGPNQYSKSVTSTISMPPGSGKWYWECVFTRTSSSDGGVGVGIVPTTWSPGEATGSPSVLPGLTSDSWGINGNDGNKYNGGQSTSYGSSFASGDIIMVAYDANNGSFYVGKNGTWFNSGAPASNTGYAFTGIRTEMIPAFTLGYDTGSSIVNVNFGQRAFSYTPPTGFNALNTFNLPDPSIKNSNRHFDAKIYTGNGGTQSIVLDGGFAPDFVWMKSRSYLYGNALFDTIRGATTSLQSQDTAGDETRANDLTGFNSNGFTIGSGTNVNQTSNTYVAWAWNAGGSSATNTDGTITSTVRANPTAGFSIVSYTGSGAAGTIGHGLNAIPSMIIVKNRTTGSTQWVTWHKGMSGAFATDGAYAYLNTTAQSNNTSVFFNGTQISKKVFGFRGGNSNVNASPDNYIAYCWTDIPGYSSFGSYTGNGSTDGPFLYTGFKPKFVMFKRVTTDGASWHIFDGARNPSNPVDTNLYPNGTNTDTQNNTMDFLVNGFKCKSTDTDNNNSGSTVIYAAFAEYPFKNGNAAIYNIN